MSKKSIVIEQFDKKIATFVSLQKVAPPTSGWVNAIRKALGMTLQQLAKRLNITKQGVQDLERRERDGGITIKTLREVAKSLDMQLVYGFIPSDGSLEKLIERKALELAKEIVMRTSQTMKLENQENSTERINKAIQQRATSFKNDIPKMLWD